MGKLHKMSYTEDDKSRYMQTCAWLHATVRSTTEQLVLGALRSKWYFLPSLITTAVLDAFVLISIYFLVELMRKSGCTTVLENVVIPFIGTVPFVFLSKHTAYHIQLLGCLMCIARSNAS